MSKIHIEKNHNFTIVNNEVLRNKNLSLKAKGLFAFMWSLPDDWDYSVAGLTKILKEGKDAINEALKELERERYLVRTVQRKGGKFANIDYTLYETPQNLPFTDFPQTGNPITENPQQINTKKNQTKKKSNKEKTSFPTEMSGGAAFSQIANSEKNEDGIRVF
ncbi:MAG: helix-turn-helix domain-containing protein [Clostridiales bacterium]|nr:helix-turn-helix domain-containing protein [Clostridiales bacterium]